MVVLAGVLAGCSPAHEPAGEPAPMAGSGAAGATAEAIPAGATPSEGSETGTAERAAIAADPLRMTDGLVTIVPLRCHVGGVDLVGDSPLDVIGRFEFVGDRLYVVDRDGHVRRFTTDFASGCLLELDRDWADNGVLTFDGEVTELAALDDGRLLASTGVFGSFFVAPNGTIGSRCDAFDQGNVAMAPDGSWGIGHFVSDALRRITFVDGVCTVDDFAWDSPFHMVSAVRITADRIYVGGTISERIDADRPERMVAYNHLGQQLWTTGNADDPFAPDGYGYFHAIEPCGDAICVVDSNLRRLHVVGPDGVQRAVFDLGRLLGLEWPWVTDLEALPDGSALISGAQDRPGTEQYEALIYRLEYR
jgi:hypothetical protein